MVHIPTDGTLRPFSIGVQEVTWREMDLFRKQRRMDGDEVEFSQALLEDRAPERKVFAPEHPAVTMTWHTAVEYCEWLSQKTGAYFRLPTEREWDYVFRTGDDASVPLEDKGWHRENAGGLTHPVGCKKPDRYGIHDLLGNAGEYALEPPSPPGLNYVLLGGSWRTPREEGLATRRQTIDPGWFECDPYRPHRMRWFVDLAPSQGMRLVRVAGTEDQEERKHYRDRIEVRLTEVDQKLTVRFGPFRVVCSRVKGTVKNLGDRAVDDLEIQYFPLNVDGSPHLMDMEVEQAGLLTWGKVWPALSNSAHEGAHRRPLAPGEMRTFEGMMPQSFDGEDWVPPDPPRKFAARVTNLRFCP
jgi:hypothetical protein